MSEHRPVTTCFDAPHQSTIVFFYCPCGVHRRLIAVGTDVHPVGRFTAAVRRRHVLGLWPPADVDATELTDSDLADDVDELVGLDDEGVVA
jgi:hypothetical protein